MRSEWEIIQMIQQHPDWTDIDIYNHASRVERNQDRDQSIATLCAIQGLKKLEPEFLNHLLQVGYSKK